MCIPALPTDLSHNIIYTVFFFSLQNQRSTRQAVSIEVAGGLLSLRTPATLNSVRTPAFLRTLSENIFQYDLVEEDDQAPAQNLQLSDNVLNRHECAGTLTALLSRVSVLEGVNWRDALVATLEGSARANVKWLLTQVSELCGRHKKAQSHSAGDGENYTGSMRRSVEEPELRL
ncbi:jg25757 [Pararge aegeria aegeria]|uniref:Jg25757 protein n=1 Tax=Pararge aegeria aegeria TaxID=348720 RepID=A0A8S4QH67_9NEOP|nr:jg25757 [Pararge aegeria aegeria]